VARAKTRVTKKAKAEGRVLTKKSRRPTKAQRVQNLKGVLADPKASKRAKDAARRYLAVHKMVAA